MITFLCDLCHILFSDFEVVECTQFRECTHSGRRAVSGSLSSVVRRCVKAYSDPDISRESFIWNSHRGRVVSQKDGILSYATA